MQLTDKKNNKIYTRIHLLILFIFLIVIGFFLIIEKSYASPTWNVPINTSGSAITSSAFSIPIPNTGQGTGVDYTFACGSDTTPNTSCDSTNANLS